MSHIKIQEVPNPEGFKVEITSDFKKNRAMQQRAQRMMSDPSLPQVIRDNAKSEMIHYSMENIRSTDNPTSVNVGKVAVGEHLLIEPETGEFSHRQRVKNIEDELRRHHDENDPLTLSDEEYAQALADRTFALDKADEDTKTPKEIAELLRNVENSPTEEHADA